MRVKSRRHGLLQQYELECSSSLRLAARSETHDMAHIRLRRDDVKAIEKGTLCTKIVGLFSTNNSREPVFLRSSDTLFVQLPNTEENEKLLPCTTECTNDELESKKEDKTFNKTFNQTKNNIYSKTKKEFKAAFTPFSVAAHHSYVTGMRVSGIINRAIVHLELKKG
jgi:hypothetical protein